MSQERIEEAIREIAARNGVAVGRDDPIMILQTISELLMRDQVKAQEQILANFKSELEGIAFQWGEDSKKRAEKILNAALAASQNAMTEVMATGARQTVEVVQKEIERIGVDLEKPIHESKRIAQLNIFAAGLAVFAAGVALLANLL